MSDYFGPWRYEESTHSILDKDDDLVIDADSGDFTAHEREKNANLIAAAPELLEALQEMLNKAYKQNWNDQYPDEIEAAQNAISKALGQ